MIEAWLSSSEKTTSPARAGAVAHGRLGGRLAHAWVVGQAQVVVRAEQQHGPPVEQHARALRARNAAEPAVEAPVADVLESFVYLAAHRSSVSLLMRPRASRVRLRGRCSARRPAAPAPTTSCGA